MAETCIVCLGELGHDPPPPSLQGPLSPTSDPKPAEEEPEIASPKGTPELIAHLIPCGHNLHDGCLRPWVERANSCPICRQNFNSVQLSESLGGPVTSSYDVSDRAQEAEIDPAMFMDEPEEETAPCPKCGQEDNEDVLLLCDSCNSAYHTYCVGLDAVPPGHWFCEECETVRAIEAVGEAPSTRPANHHASNRRTRGQIRRARNQDDVSSSSWARVWQTVWDRLNIDLDFPFDGPTTRNQHRRGGIRAWERRLQVAERQGGTSRFRDTAPAIFDRPTMSRPRPEPPKPESTEEILAWNALEKARVIQSDPSTRSRKRKSTSRSPHESDGPARKRARQNRSSSPSELPAPQAERPLKRPNTRRAPGLQLSNGTNGESSRPRQRSIASVGASSPDAITTAPTFLQSLLREVESSAVPEEGSAQAHNNSDHPSPQNHSAGPSPVASNHPSPGPTSGTPPPISPRSLSPVLLSSSIEPVYPRAPDLFYEELSPMAKELRRRESKSQTRIPRWVAQQTNGTETEPVRPRARSEEASPTRLSMSLSAKESVQKLVKEALREPYLNKLVTKDQYTDINRTVSRLLYEKVGEHGVPNGNSNGNNAGTDTQDEWQQLARNEVLKAIAGLEGETTS